MCKVQKCHDKHQKHFCSICQNTDSNHFSFNCPLSKIGYYGTTAQISKKIKEHGFLPSKKGTESEGIYFWDTMDEAKLKAQEKYKNVEIVVIECKIPENELSKEPYFVKIGDSEDVIKQKLFQWYNKSKDLPASKLKTPWHNKFSCVRYNKNIKIVKYHEVK